LTLLLTYAILHAKSRRMGELQIQLPPSPIKGLRFKEFQVLAAPKDSEVCGLE
jgi:hypothetical protein